MSVGEGGWDEITGQTLNLAPGAYAAEVEVPSTMLPLGTAVDAALESALTADGFRDVVVVDTRPAGWPDTTGTPSADTRFVFASLPNAITVERPPQVTRLWHSHAASPPTPTPTPPTPPTPPPSSNGAGWLLLALLVLSENN